MESVKKYNNIVLFTNGAIGDFLMGALCAGAAAEKIKGSNVTILTPRNASIFRDLFSAYPNVQIYEANRRHFSSLVLFVVRVLWQRNLVINKMVFKNIPFHTRVFARLLTMRSGSTYVHFAREGTSDERAEKRTVAFDYHRLVYENLVRLFNTQNLGISSHIPDFHFVHDPNILERYGLTRSMYVVIHPCAFSASRSLPAARWARLLEYVATNFPDVKIVITGSKQDSHFINKISEVLPPSIPFINLSGKPSMTELANIIYGARGYIGVDTGITHLAGVLQKRSVVIGNLSNPCWLPRYNKNAVILAESKNCACDGEKGGNCFSYIDGERYYKCMLDIPEEVIYENIKNMLTKELSYE